MGSRDSKYQLDKIVELDESFFETINTEKDEDEKSEPKKRGRGSQKQTTVMVWLQQCTILKKLKSSINLPNSDMSG